MAAASARVRECKQIFRRYLGKAVLKSWQKILCEIVIVCIELKPSLLYDYSAVSAGDMCEFLTALNAEGLLPSKCQLIVLTVESEVFVCNQRYMRRYVSGTSKIILVDVSQKLSAPGLCVAEFSESVIKSIKNTILLNLPTETTHDERNLVQDTKIVDLSLLSTINRTTLYGFLVGYPVLYWYDEKDEGSNCLGMVPLNVYNTTLSVENCVLNVNETDNKVSLTAFSFSVPLVFKDVVQDAVNSWYLNLCSQVSKSNTVCNLNMTNREVCLPAIAL